MQRVWYLLAVFASVGNPGIAGGVVANMPKVVSIAILNERSSIQLVAGSTPYNPEGFISARINMAITNNVHAVIKADGKYHAAVREVKASLGGYAV